MAWASRPNYGSHWPKLRLRVLKAAHFLCQCEDCVRLDRVRIADEVDHIVPKAKGGTDDVSNLQAINHECHDAKTARELGRTLKPKRRIGPDGWPV